MCTPWALITWPSPLSDVISMTLRSIASLPWTPRESCLRLPPLWLRVGLTNMHLRWSHGHFKSDGNHYTLAQVLEFGPSGSCICQYKQSLFTHVCIYKTWHWRGCVWLVRWHLYHTVHAGHYYVCAGYTYSSKCYFPQGSKVTLMRSCLHLDVS